MTPFQRIPPSYSGKSRDNSKSIFSKTKTEILTKFIPVTQDHYGKTLLQLERNLTWPGLGNWTGSEKTEVPDLSNRKCHDHQVYVACTLLAPHKAPQLSDSSPPNFLRFWGSNRILAKIGESVSQKTDSNLSTKFMDQKHIVLARALWGPEIKLFKI